MQKDQIPLPLLTDIERGYVAGLFDGEGCVRASKVTRKWQSKVDPDKTTTHLWYRADVRIANTNYEVIDWLCNIFGGGIYDHSNQKDRPKHWKQSWVWVATSRDECYRFLKLIEPICIVKRESVRVAIKFIETKWEHHGARDHEKLDKMIQRLRDLKKQSR